MRILETSLPAEPGGSVPEIILERQWGKKCERIGEGSIRYEVEGWLSNWCPDYSAHL